MQLTDIKTDTAYKFKGKKLPDGRMSYFVTTQDGLPFGAIVRTNDTRGTLAEFYVFPIRQDGKGFMRNAIGRFHGRDACAITLRKWWADKNAPTKVTTTRRRRGGQSTLSARAGKAA